MKDIFGWFWCWKIEPVLGNFCQVTGWRRTLYLWNGKRLFVAELRRPNLDPSRN